MALNHCGNSVIDLYFVEGSIELQLCKPAPTAPWALAPAPFLGFYLFRDKRNTIDLEAISGR